MASSKEDSLETTETLFISDVFFTNKKFLTWLYFSDGFVFFFLVVLTRL